MKDRKPKNPTASVRHRLQTLSRKTGEPFQTLLIRYALERFLFRLTQTAYKDKFILKGAVLFAIWTGEMHRPTKDLDLLGSGKPDQAALRDVFHTIASIVDADDGLTFLPGSVVVNRIREEQEYGGLRITLTAKLGNSRIPLQIDVGFGDAVTPAAKLVELPTLLSMPAPTIRVYPKETVVAEKYQAMVMLGMANSRMKDFFDLWILCRSFPFHGSTLSDAIRATFRRRKTELPDEIPVALSGAFAGDTQKQTQWKAFVRRSNLSEKVAPLADVLTLLRSFLLPPSRAASSKQDFDQDWPLHGPWQQKH